MRSLISFSHGGIDWIKLIGGGIMGLAYDLMFGQLLVNVPVI